MSTQKTFQPLQYAEQLARDDCFRVKPGQLFAWVGTHWQRVDSFEAERHALGWIVRSKTGIANQVNARSAVQTAMLHLPMLSDVTNGRSTVIPLSNGYLHIDADAYVTLRDHDRELSICHLIDCTYDPDAPEPAQFLDFVERILPDRAVRERVQEYLGYTLMGDARFQRAQMWIGSGANGKGTLAGIVQAFHREVAAVQLDATTGFKLTGLLNASLIYCDEAPTSRINEPILKSMIAGELLQIDRKYRDPVTARVTGKWLVLANALPQIVDQSEGFWRRFDIVPFTVCIPEKERDPLLTERILAEERSGLLNWLLVGLVRLLRRGHFDVTAAAVDGAAREAQIEADSLRAWINEASVCTGRECVHAKRFVYQKYADWCKENGMTALSSMVFWRRLDGLLGGIEYDRMTTSAGRIRTCNVFVADPS